MMIPTSQLRCLLFTLALATPTSVSANWTIERLVNRSDHPVTLSIPIPKGVHQSGGDMTSVRGNMALTILGSGIIYFEDKGHSSGCQRPYWAVKITFRDKQWGYYYDGGGKINVAINENGIPQFIAYSGGSQVVVGSGKAKCY